MTKEQKKKKNLINGFESYAIFKETIYQLQLLI